MLFLLQDIPEPVYKLKQEKKFIPKFEKFPKGQAFNWFEFIILNQL